MGFLILFKQQYLLDLDSFSDNPEKPLKTVSFWSLYFICFIWQEKTLKTVFWVVVFYLRKKRIKNS